MTGAFTAIGFGLAISAALIYIVLRFLVAQPNASNTIQSVSRHAFWTALIAFFASGTSGLSNLWANPDQQLQNQGGTPAMLMHAAAPGLWLGIVYVLGQFTWPRHLRPVRAASLEVRSVKSLIPKFLAAFLLLCTAISTVLIVVAWNDPGAPQRAGRSQVNAIDLPIHDGDTDAYGNPLDEGGNMLYLTDEDEYMTRAQAEAMQDTPEVSAITGTRPGNVVGPYLLGGLGLVLLGSFGAASLVVRRPPLDSLDARQNAVLRTIWINRLLRTGIVVVAGFGMACLNYLSEGIRARADWALPGSGTGGHIDHSAWDRANALTGPGTVWVLVVLVVVVACRPPRLGDVPAAHATAAGPASPSFSKARDFLLLAQGVCLIGVLVAGGFAARLSGGTEVSAARETSGDSDAGFPRLLASTASPRIEELASLAGSLAVLVLGYFLIQLLCAHLVARRLGTGDRPAHGRAPLLPVWILVTVVIAAAAGLSSVALFLRAAPPEIAFMAWWFLGVMVLAGLLAWMLHRMAAGRGALDGATAGEDRRIRILVAHRGARMFGGVSLLVAASLANLHYWGANAFTGPDGGAIGVDTSGFQVAVLALGVALCLLPAATAMPGHRPVSDTRSPSMSGSGH